MYTCIHPALKVQAPNLRGHSTDRPTDRQDGVGANIYDLIIPLELRLGMGASEERRALGFCTGRVANHSEGAAWKVGNPALTFHYNNPPGHLLTISLAYCSSLSFLYSGRTTSDRSRGNELLHPSVVLYRSHSSMLET
jgi:hypothetical protein